MYILDFERFICEKLQIKPVSKKGFQSEIEDKIIDKSDHSKEEYDKFIDFLRKNNKLNLFIKELNNTLDEEATNIATDSDFLKNLSSEYEYYRREFEFDNITGFGILIDCYIRESGTYRGENKIEYCSVDIIPEYIQIFNNKNGGLLFEFNYDQSFAENTSMILYGFYETA